ncbi:MAG TPA: FAD binding domain-containing protein, partial [Segetibacter sp.]
VGGLKDEEVIYRSYTSCLTPLGNVDGKHVVTIEGINMGELNPVQQAMTDCSATQCGFCTPGFVVSLAGFCLSKKEATKQNAIASIDGNICRCTGYKSIERAAAMVAKMLEEKGTEEPAAFVTRKDILPAYFAGIKDRLKRLPLPSNGPFLPQNTNAAFVGGGTDLYVQKHDEMKYADIHFTTANSVKKEISKVGNRCIIGPSVTVTDLQESPIFRQYFPRFDEQVKLISSTPIRNMATIAGNFINASPIGDFTIFFLALNATIVLSNGETIRELPLRKLYKGYKLLDKTIDEFVERIWFELPDKNSLFNFEKVSKRTNLDIASVNTAIHIKTENNVIIEASISAGGVSPIPLYLEKASGFLQGKILSEELIIEATEVAQTEISPISDARGTAEYKRLLLNQLIKAHFIVLFPEIEVVKLLSL